MMGKNTERLFVAIITVVMPYGCCVNLQPGDGLALQKLIEYEANVGTVQVSSEISATQFGSASNKQSGSRPIAEQSVYVSNEIKVISYWLWIP